MYAFFIIMFLLMISFSIIFRFKTESMLRHPMVSCKGLREIYGNQFELFAHKEYEVEITDHKRSGNGVL